MTELFCYGCYSHILAPVVCSRCRVVWFCSYACLASDSSHRDYCSLFTVDHTPLLFPAKRNLILATLLTKGLRLQEQLCYTAALNIYQLVLRLPIGVVDASQQFECYLFGAMCISGDCTVPTWTKECIQKLHKAKEMVEMAKLLCVRTSSSACNFAEDRLLDLSRVEVDIDQKLSFVLENHSFEEAERNFPCFLHPSKRFYHFCRR